MSKEENLKKHIQLCNPQATKFGTLTFYDALRQGYSHLSATTIDEFVKAAVDFSDNGRKLFVHQFHFRKTEDGTRVTLGRPQFRTDNDDVAVAWHAALSFARSTAPAQSLEPLHKARRSQVSRRQAPIPRDPGAPEPVIYVTGKPAVTSMGRMRTEHGVIDYLSPNLNGYCMAHYKGGTYPLHCLIAAAFDLPREPDQFEVDHIDSNRSNNLVENLRYATKSEQSLNQKDNTTRTGSYTSTEAFVLPGEVWREPPNLPGYKVSNLGRWRTKKSPHVSFTPTPKPMQPYAECRVYLDDKATTLKIHRVVALTFVVKPDGWADDHKVWTVDHLNADKTDNRAANLEWVTRAENARRARLNASDASKAKRKERITKPIEGRRRGETEWVRYESNYDASKILRISSGSINQSIQNRIYGNSYEWRYAPNPKLELLPGEILIELTPDIAKKARLISGKCDVTSVESDTAGSSKEHAEMAAVATSYESHANKKQRV
tara:strand:- start:105 stop:1574 length:1470 start_codon:yes stop_codon:yes gene_type:complete